MDVEIVGAALGDDEQRLLARLRLGGRPDRRRRRQRGPGRKRGASFAVSQGGRPTEQKQKPGRISPPTAHALAAAPVRLNPADVLYCSKLQRLPNKQAIDRGSPLAQSAWRSAILV